MQLGLPLRLVDRQLFLPETLNLTLMLLFTHAATLGVHLLESLVFGELLHEFELELFFHALLFGSTLRLQLHLELLGCLQLFAYAHSLLCLSPFLGLGSSFSLLVEKLISEVLFKFVLSPARIFFRFELLKDLATCFLSLGLQGVQLILAGLLLGSVTADHLVFISFHLCLSLLQCALLTLRHNHVILGLVFLLGHDSCHLGILLNHALDHTIDLFAFAFVLSARFFSHSIVLVDLKLDHASLLL